MTAPKQFGAPVPEVECKFPPHVPVTGKHVALHPMQANHADKLFRHIGGSANSSLYDYMFYGGFADSEIERFRKHIANLAESETTQFYSIEDLKTGELVGHTSHLRMDLTHRVIEIGHIMYGPPLQRTVAATEAWYLLARKAFDDGFRRLEWKCDNSNNASKRAAARYGHTFEGVFRQHMIIKGKNRDSAWFSILDKEWPLRKEALENWMDASNFDDNGRQKKDLAAFQKDFAEA